MCPVLFVDGCQGPQTADGRRFGQVTRSDMQAEERRDGDSGDQHDRHDCDHDSFPPDGFTACSLAHQMGPVSLRFFPR